MLGTECLQLQEVAEEAHPLGTALGSLILGIYKPDRS